MNDIHHFIFDVDGVLYKQLAVFVTTEILRTMNIDGYAIKQLWKAAIMFALFQENNEEFA
jgi:3-deoxy-D-manno-octulosonate 8-phosphate phosphatase KdsC-like HAD superfamily phosphatase